MSEDRPLSAFEQQRLGMARRMANVSLEIARLNCIKANILREAEACGIHRDDVRTTSQALVDTELATIRRRWYADPRKWLAG